MALHRVSRDEKKNNEWYNFCIGSRNEGITHLTEYTIN